MVTRILELDPGQLADVNGFETMQLLLKAIADVDPRGWRVLGGWMVRAYSSGGSLRARVTTDVDLSMFPNRAGNVGKKVPSNLHDAGFRAGDEPFKLMLDSHEIDLLIPPGSSRYAKIGTQEVFEADGTAFAFELDAEPLDVLLEEVSLRLQTARLSAALIAKAVLFGAKRPKHRDDAVDVGLLLDAVARDEEAPMQDLRANRKRSDVKKGLRVLKKDFEDPEGAGTRAIRGQRDVEEALTAAANARRLLALL